MQTVLRPYGKSKRPLLYIGGGLNSKAASDKIREFNRMFNIPLINSLMGKGILDESLDTSLGMLGMFGTPYANMAIQETDLFVAFGVRWNDRVAQKVGESGLKAEIAYIDINAAKVQEVRVTRSPKFSFIGDASYSTRGPRGVSPRKLHQARHRRMAEAGLPQEAASR